MIWMRMLTTGFMDRRLSNQSWFVTCLWWLRLCLKTTGFRLLSFRGIHRVRNGVCWCEHVPETEWQTDASSCRMLHGFSSVHSYVHSLAWANMARMVTLHDSELGIWHLLSYKRDGVEKPVLMMINDRKQMNRKQIKGKTYIHWVTDMLFQDKLRLHPL